MAEADADERDEAATETAHQVDDVGLYEIGSRLVDLGEQLRTVGRHADNNNLRMELDHLRLLTDHEPDREHYETMARVISTTLRRTLSGLASFRREYATQERLTVEYCLRQGMTQRDIARFLGVGLSTVNRWAQHPLTYDEE